MYVLGRWKGRKLLRSLEEAHTETDKKKKCRAKSRTNFKYVGTRPEEKFRCAAVWLYPNRRMLLGLIITVSPHAGRCVLKWHTGPGNICGGFRWSNDGETRPSENSAA